MCKIKLSNDRTLRTTATHKLQKRGIVRGLKLPDFHGGYKERPCLVANDIGNYTEGGVHGGICIKVIPITSNPYSNFDIPLICNINKNLQTVSFIAPTIEYPLMPSMITNDDLNGILVCPDKVFELCNEVRRLLLIDTHESITEAANKVKEYRIEFMKEYDIDEIFYPLSFNTQYKFKKVDGDYIEEVIEVQADKVRRGIKYLGIDTSIEEDEEVPKVIVTSVSVVDKPNIEVPNREIIPIEKPEANKTSRVSKQNNVKTSPVSTSGKYEYNRIKDLDDLILTLYLVSGTESISKIAKLTQLSTATIDKIVNNRPINPHEKTINKLATYIASMSDATKRVIVKDISDIFKNNKSKVKENDKTAIEKNGDENTNNPDTSNNKESVSKTSIKKTEIDMKRFPRFSTTDELIDFMKVIRAFNGKPVKDVADHLGIKPLDVNVKYRSACTELSRRGLDGKIAAFNLN